MAKLQMITFTWRRFVQFQLRNFRQGQNEAKTSSVAIKIEIQLIEYLIHIQTLFRLTVFISFTEQSIKFIQLVSYDFATTETSNWYYLLLIICIQTKFISYSINLRSGCFILSEKCNQALKGFEFYIKFKLQMKNNLEKKIAQYRQEKSKKGILENLISQKRKNLEKMISQESSAPIQKQNDFRIENYAKQIDFAHQKYLDDMDELQNTKFKIIELKGVHETLKLEIKLQQDNLSNCMISYKRQLAALEEIIEKTKIRMANQKDQKLKMFNQRCQTHISGVEKLTLEKQNLINQSCKLLEKFKISDLDFKRIKDNYEEKLKVEKQNWLRIQQERREKWQQKKMEQINENTLRGLEPAIQRIVNNSKKQISEIQQRYESLKNEYKAEMYSEYEKNLDNLKKSALNKIEQQKMFLKQKSNDHYRKLTEKLVQSYQSQRLKIKVAKQAEARQLQERRKKETQYFMLKNKDFFMSHLSQVKQIKSSYERQIQQLDTSVDKLLQKEQKSIQQKYALKIESYRQDKRKILEQRMKAFHVKQKQLSQSQYQDLVQKVACQNQVFQSELKSETESKIKKFKQNSEAQIKNIRKTVQSLLNKENLQKESLNKILEVRNDIQLEYSELQQQCEYLKKKELQYQSQVVALKTKQGQQIQSQSLQLQNVARHWQQQIQILMHKSSQLQNQMQTQQKVMKEKADEEKAKYTGLVNALDKNSLQIFKKMNQEIQRGRKEKQMKIVLNKKLLETKKKMKELQLKKKTEHKM